MATILTAIVATNANTEVLPLDTTRRQLYLKCYAYVPGTTNPQTGVIYVAFGKPATLGLNGELELVPGGEYIFGGPIPPRVANLPHGFILPNAPTEPIDVITATGTVYGTIMVQ